MFGKALAVGATLALTGCGMTVTISPSETPATTPPAPAHATSKAVSTTDSWIPARVSGAKQVTDAIEREGVRCATGWAISQYDQQGYCESPHIRVFVALTPERQELMESNRALYRGVFVPGGVVLSNEHGNWIIGADAPASTTLTAATLRPYA